MGMYDRDWYKEQYNKRKSGVKPQPVRHLSDREKNNLQNMLNQTYSKKHSRSSHVRNTVIFLVMTLTLTFGLKVILGNSDISIETLKETIGLGKGATKALNGNP